MILSGIKFHCNSSGAKQDNLPFGTSLKVKESTFTLERLWLIFVFGSNHDISAYSYLCNHNAYLSMSDKNLISFLTCRY